MDEGKWIKDTKFKKLGYAMYACSHCGKIVVLGEDSPFEDISEYKYCFNCGAKMGVEK